MLPDSLYHVPSYTKHCNKPKIILEKCFGENSILTSGVQNITCFIDPFFNFSLIYSEENTTAQKVARQLKAVELKCLSESTEQSKKRIT